MKTIKVVVERHPDGYVAYPIGLKGVVVGQGDTYEEALADVRSAIEFHIETFGNEALDTDSPRARCFRDRSHGGCLMPAFPVDAPKDRVVQALNRLGFVVVLSESISACVEETPMARRLPISLRENSLILPTLDFEL